MNTFTVRLLGADRGETLEEVSSFVGEDASGTFGLLAHHVRFITVLSFGLARLRLADGRRRFVALPGAVLYFVDNVLSLSTRHYLLGDDAGELAAALARRMGEEERSLAATLKQLRQLEAGMLQRLARLEVE